MVGAQKCTHIINKDLAQSQHATLSVFRLKIEVEQQN